MAKCTAAHGPEEGVVTTCPKHRLPSVCSTLEIDLGLAMIESLSQESGLQSWLDPPFPSMRPMIEQHLYLVTLPVTTLLASLSRHFDSKWHVPAPQTARMS
jgi:hypothetical protein